MSYSEILIELSQKNDLQQTELVHESNYILLDEIISEIPHKKVILTQLLFAIDQINELIKLTYDHNAVTGLHLGRVGRLGALLATKAKLHWKDKLECLYGGWIHDVGKIYIPERILDKPGKLTHEEYEHIKLHVQFGCNILKCYPHLEPYLSPVRFHHERWDGTGYPHRIAATDIPISGRLIGIVDAYDAMTSSRPYPPTQKDHQSAINEIHRCLGTHFDPVLGALFCQIPESEIRALTH